MDDVDNFKSQHEYGTAGYFADLFKHYPAGTKVSFWIPHEVKFASNYSSIPRGTLHIDLEKA